MKTKVLLLLAIIAVATLSFTFTSKNTDRSQIAVPQRTDEKAPIGGFVMEDKI